ncbi:MAG: RNA-binding protein [Flavobacteriaceae bacterium]|jgi:RNA recognition motif-containing protein|nr:RNA-binding protein [Flavobacteriaceae bacterium]
MNIFISNLDYSTTERELQMLFENYGTVESIKIVTDRETGKSRGFGFVEMSDDEEALKAIEELNKSDYKSRTLNVSESKPQEQRSQNRGFERNKNFDRRKRY